VAGWLQAAKGGFPGDVATLCWPIDVAGEVDDPNSVKVVFDQTGRALYFSRAAIPFARDVANAAQAMDQGVVYFRHLGLYAYRHSALKRFTASPPTVLEETERLEQLRFQELGLTIRVAVALERIPPGIDTAQDLHREREARQQS
jgi:3-deoxy-manno-octulosonate cytidylyltransferase (CMP-KDO synthetase)